MDKLVRDRDRRTNRKKGRDRTPNKDRAHKRDRSQRKRSRSRSRGRDKVPEFNARRGLQGRYAERLEATGERTRIRNKLRRKRLRDLRKRLYRSTQHFLVSRTP